MAKLATTIGIRADVATHTTPTHATGSTARPQSCTDTADVTF